MPRLQGFDRVVLVGHSYGCLLVTRLASQDDAQRIAAVVCISAGFPLPSTFRMRWIFYLPTFVRSLPQLFTSRTLPAALE
jgi:pimeloyl-ACP methyl ester carboxylesterase